MSRCPPREELAAVPLDTATIAPRTVMAAWHARQTVRRGGSCEVRVSATLPVVFDGPELRAVCGIVSEKAIKEASEITDERVLSASVEELVEDSMFRHDMEMPRLAERWEVTEGGSRQAIELHLPFTGTPGLLSNQPNLYGPPYPEGRVVGEELVVPLGQPVGAEARANTWKQLVEQWLRAVEHDLEIWRQELRQQLRGFITRRRQEAERHQEGLRGLGIPIRPRDDAPRTFTEPAIARRQPGASASAGNTGAAEPQPALREDYYDHILFVIRAAGKAMERSPETYEGWGEENRRQVLILMLNTHYAGKVYAEAFNGDGKTDILIRDGDRNVFIGECKFYEGPQSVTETLDQIFGYATLRDVKLAIVFFVDRIGFTEAVERIRQTVEQSEQFKRWLSVSQEQETEFRAQMAWPGDERRLVTLHVSAFHTPRGAAPDLGSAPDVAEPAL